MSYLRDFRKENKVKMNYSYDHDDKNEINEKEETVQQYRSRRKSRVQERELFFKKIEDKIESIKRSTDFYKKQKSDKFYEDLKNSLNSPTRRKNSDVSLKSTVTKHSKKVTLPSVEKTENSIILKPMIDSNADYPNKDQNCLKEYLNNKETVFERYVPKRKYKTHELCKLSHS